MHTFTRAAVRLGLAIGTLGALSLQAGSAEAALLVGLSPSDTIVSYSDGDQGASAPVSLPFAFNFFGSSQTEVYINTNGSLTFATGDADTTFDTFPTVVGPNLGRIAPVLDDLILSPTGSDIRYSASVPGVFAVTWNSVGIANGFGGALSNNSVTAQAALLGAGNPFGFAPGSIVFSYGPITDASPFLSAGLNAGNGTGAAVLPATTGSNIEGVLSRTQFLALSNSNGFVFSPAGDSYTVFAVPEPEMLPGLLSLTLLGLGTVGVRRLRRA